MVTGITNGLTHQAIQTGYPLAKIPGADGSTNWRLVQ